VKRTVPAPLPWPKVALGKVVFVVVVHCSVPERIVPAPARSISK